MMLKFQTDYTTTIETFEKFILTIFVVIDDLYQQYTPIPVWHRKHIKDAKLSDFKSITISLFRNLFSIDSENTYFSFLKWLP